MVKKLDPGSGLSVMSSGQLIVGRLLSTTMTSVVQVLEFPATSETVSVTVIGAPTSAQLKIFGLTVVE